jgi:hypothetical protein
LPARVIFRLSAVCEINENTEENFRHNQVYANVRILLHVLRLPDWNRP